jgi:F-type H+-transporting ATPase subunit a
VSGDVLLASDAGCHLNSGCGFPAPDAGIFNFDSVVQFDLLGLTFHITKPLILLWIGALTVVVFFVVAFRRAKVVPRGAQNIGEYGYLFVRDGIARDTIGKAGDEFVPLLFSFFFFVWILSSR